jgi:hypothetical protein
MKKTLTMNGINGSFAGDIEIKWNYRSESKLVQQPVTHDEVMRAFTYHKVVGSIGAELFEGSEFQNENLVWQYIDEIEKKINARLHILANVPKTRTLLEQLQDKGFK